MNTIFTIFLRMSLQGIVIILTILFVRFLLKRFHISHKYFIVLWVIVFFYLIFPFKISMSDGFWDNNALSEHARIIFHSSKDADKNVVGSNGQNSSNVTDIPVIINLLEENNTITGRTDIQKTFESNSLTDEATTSNFQTSDIAESVNASIVFAEIVLKYLPYVWLFAILLMFGYLIYSYQNVKQKLLLSIPYEDRIWWTEGIDTPMVFGFFHPQIYLPLSIKEQDFKYIVAHEEMHLYRKDTQIKMLAYIICILHWFNPLVWIAYMLLGSDIENACDEEVIHELGSETKKEYASALLRIASGNMQKRSLIFAAPICFGEGNVKFRIKNVLKYNYTLPQVGIRVVMITLVLALMFLTETDTVNAVSSQIAQKQESQEISQEPLIDEEFYTEATKNLPIFYIENVEALEVHEPFSIDDYYITNRWTVFSHYYIDENATLWGSGKMNMANLV